jgi:Peptidase family S41
VSDLESLLFHLETDYAKASLLIKNLEYQLVKKQALQSYYRLSLHKQDMMLKKIILKSGDKHLRLEPIAQPTLAIKLLYDKHFGSFYDPLAGLPAQHQAATPIDSQPVVGLIDPNVVLWRVPSAHVQYLKPIQDAFALYASSLASLPYWIIDLRGNAGGTDRIWSFFWPYLSTGVLVQGGTSFWASAGNREYFGMAAASAASFGCADDAQWYKSVVQAMQQVQVGFVEPNLAGFAASLHLDTAKDQPQKFIVLIDDKTASSAETLIEMAKQSMKGIIVGQSASKGCTDSGNLRYAILPSRRWGFYFGTSISNNSQRVPIDKGGYQPDILLPTGSADLLIPWSIAYLKSDRAELSRIYKEFATKK